MRPGAGLGEGSPYPSPGSPVGEFGRSRNLSACKTSRYAHGAVDRRVNNRTVISFPPRLLISLLLFPYLKVFIYLFIYFVFRFLFLPKSVWSPVHVQPCQHCL